MNQLQKAASLMGKMGKGIKKQLTAEERQRRKLWMQEICKKKWAKK